MLRTQSCSEGQVNTVLASQLSLHEYSHLLFSLQAHSPGHLIGAVVSVQSQCAWQGPPNVDPPHENRPNEHRPNQKTEARRRTERMSRESL